MTATPRATKDTVLPLSEPIFDQNGTRLDEIAMPKGSQVLLGFLGCNTNKKLWGEDAYEWKPERWLGPLPESLTEAHIPSVFAHTMTFAAGPRSCMCVLSLIAGSVCILIVLVIS